MSFLSGDQLLTGFLLVLGSPQEGSLICSREYEKSSRTHFFLSSILCVFFWILIANGDGEFLFANRVSCSGVMNLKAGICSKIFTL